MKTTKKILSVLLSVVLCLSVLSVAASAKVTVLASGTCGENITWTYTSDKTLTVSGTGALEQLYNEELEESYSPWETAIDAILNEKYGIESVEDLLAGEITEEKIALYIAYAQDETEMISTLIVEEGITSIGDCVFSGLYSAVIDLPASLESIGCDAIDATDTKKLVIRNPELEIGEESILITGFFGETAPYATPEEQYAAAIAELRSYFEGTYTPSPELGTEYYLGQEPRGYEEEPEAEPEEEDMVPLVPAPWLTVYGEEGSTAQTAAETSGVAFKTLEDYAKESASETKQPTKSDFKFAKILAKFMKLLEKLKDLLTNLLKIVK